ncbi:hypothetical protein NNC19_04965 [Clostridium sp. SHJSY1]|uniref:hypothetical protein n=1 Tax=Clostridium sp. SHJSY1 TaxID=2942483 RepID=UPI002876D1ED|nr:hypothetical protein [Clostridium sp. SHJSY1]MDS0525023.1 hypothetical protein [Clostridium sp. SHJSY1]
MVMVLSLILITVGLGVAILVGIFRGVNKSKNEIYLAIKDKEMKEIKMKNK